MYRDKLLIFSGYYDNNKMLINNKIYILDLVSRTFIFASQISCFSRSQAVLNRIYHFSEEQFIIVSGLCNSPKENQVAYFNIHKQIFQKLEEAQGNSSLLYPPPEDESAGLLQGVTSPRQLQQVEQSEISFCDIVSRGDMNNDVQLTFKCEVYEWRQIKPLGDNYTPRTGHCAVAVRDAIYLFGGSDNDCLQNDLHRYDVDSQAWSKIDFACLNCSISPRSGTKCVPLKDDIYFFGGYTHKKGAYFSDFFKLDCAALEVEALTFTGSTIQARVDHSLVSHEGNFYLYGGTNQSSLLGDLYRINPASREISLLSPIGQSPRERSGHCAEVTEEGVMLLFGGWNGEQTLNDLFTLSLRANIWYAESRTSG